MYHGILPGDPVVVPDDRETGAELYDLSLDKFKAQMNWLKDKGYNPILLDKTKITSACADPIIITFDDGELNNFQYALPVLNELGWKAYFFIIVKRIGRNGYMDWKELKCLQEAGMIIGSHGLSHEILTNLLDSQMEEELKASKNNLEVNLGVPIDSISIPRGFCNDKIIDAAYRLGYKNVFISERPQGVRANCFSRIAVKSNWSMKRFDMVLNGKYPLMVSIGSLIKKILKTVLRESGYNWLRSLLINIYR